MEGGVRPGDDNSQSHGNSDMDLVDATLQYEHSDKNQNAGVGSGSLPQNSQTQLQQDQVMVDQGDDTKNVDSTPSHMLETTTITENQLQLEEAKTLVHQELITPKLKEKNVREMKNVLNDTEVLPVLCNSIVLPSFPFIDSNYLAFHPQMTDYDEAGTCLEREAFMKELESFYRERSLEFKPPKFYGEPLNCLKYV